MNWRLYVIPGIAAACLVVLSLLTDEDWHRVVITGGGVSAIIYVQEVIRGR